MILIGKEEIIVGDYNTAKVLNTFLSNIVNNLESLGGGVPKILLRGDNPENGGLIYKWVGVGMGCHFFITLQ